MFSFLLSAIFIFALIFTSVAMPAAAASARCEERMPLTLLALYRTSDSIYVGRYEKTEDGHVTEETPEYRVVPIKKHFSISSALKGETRKMLAIEDTEYRYKETGNAAEAEQSQDEDPHDAADAFTLKPGDSVLLFVKKNAETGALELTEMIDGVKKTTPEMLGSYEVRIRELKGIFSSAKPKYSQIVDWMVRSAEDPHTRWDGTFELLQSFQNLEWQEERAKQAKENPPTEGATDEYVPEVPKEFETGDPNFAKHLTHSQKQTLTNVLLKRERPKKTEERANGSIMAHGDRELIDLVKRWGDSRVASNLLEQLRHDSSDASLNSELMASIASVLRDDELNKVSEEYSNIQWESDEDAVVLQNQPGSGNEATKEAVQPADGGPEDSKSEVKKKKTYGELRNELMAKFLVRADGVITKERNKNSAKLHR